MKKIINLLILTSAPLVAATHYALPQYDTMQAMHSPLLHTHTTNDVGNKNGVTMHVTPFWSALVKGEKVARHLTNSESGLLTVASDRFGQKTETIFPYHAIRHNPAIDASEDAAQITLAPSITNLGAVFGFFFESPGAQRKLSFSLICPLFSTILKLHPNGATPVMENFFNGTYEQTDPVQKPLTYGLWNKRRSFAYGPLMASLSLTVLETDYSFLNFVLGTSLSIAKSKPQTELFSYRSQTYDHHKIHAGFDVGHTLYDNGELFIDVQCAARYNLAFGGNEYRICGVFDDDGSIPYASPYLLGVEKDKAGVFPLTNVLHHQVSTTATHGFDCKAMLSASYIGLTCDVGITFKGHEEEYVSVREWDDNTYAIAPPTYATDAPFTNTAHTAESGDSVILLTKRFLNYDMLDTSVAASPARMSSTLFASTGYNGMISGYPFAAGLGIAYEHGWNDASCSMVSLWLKGVFSF